MILYKKTQQLRVRRQPAPEPPFWAATTIEPYGPRRAEPVSIDYFELDTAITRRNDVTVCQDVTDEMERLVERSPLHAPVLIDATESAERVFRRGDEALRFCASQGLSSMCLVSTRGELPESARTEDVVVLATWPLELARIEALCAEAGDRRLTWGMAVPVMFPVTTALDSIANLAALAAKNGAAFFASIDLDVSAVVRSVVAQTQDSDAFDVLFHGSLEPLHLATQRHIAAVAHEHGMLDFVSPPRWEERSNWNAAVLLTLTASRMIAVQQDVELAWAIAQSAKAVTALDKPLQRIADAASLSIVEALDEVSVDMLTAWLAGERPSFVERVNRDWRLRRDHGV